MYYLNFARGILLDKKAALCHTIRSSNKLTISYLHFQRSRAEMPHSPASGAKFSAKLQYRHRLPAGAIYPAKSVLSRMTPGTTMLSNPDEFAIPNGRVSS
jgi:hypothetical protein